MAKVFMKARFHAGADLMYFFQPEDLLSTLYYRQSAGENQIGKQRRRSIPGIEVASQLLDINKKRNRTTSENGLSCGFLVRVAGLEPTASTTPR